MQLEEVQSFSVCATDCQCCLRLHSLSGGSKGNLRFAVKWVNRQHFVESMYASGYLSSV